MKFRYVTEPFKTQEDYDKIMSNLKELLEKHEQSVELSTKLLEGYKSERDKVKAMFYNFIRVNPEFASEEDKERRKKDYGFRFNFKLSSPEYWEV